MPLDPFVVNVNVNGPSVEIACAPHSTDVNAVQEQLL